VEVIGVDVARVRGLYPTLATGTAQLDGSYAALQPESVIRAIISTLRSAPAQPGSRSARSQQAATRVTRARRAAADLVNGRPEDVVLGSSTVSLLLRLATIASGDWLLGDEVVVSRLDADVALHPWLRIARARGAVVRWAEVDVETGELPTWQYAELLGRRTRIVTVAMGNPAVGTVPDVRAIADLAHARGALVVVDAGAAPAYLPIDLTELGADVVAVAAPAFGGPTVAALVTRPGLLEELQVVSDDSMPPGNFEVPPLPTELLDGFSAAVDHLADLDANAQGRRRDRLGRSLRLAGEYTRGLYRVLDDGLRALPDVTVLGAADRALPVTAFTVAGRTPDQVGAFLQGHDVSVWTGDSGIGELLRVMGADEIGGATFVGLMPHTSAAEVHQLLDALRRLTD
jgi:cysteine desulfurase family protein (TIGR01976 family)